MDAYDILLQKLQLSESDFAEFGLKSILYVEFEIKKTQWEEIKKTASSKDSLLYIRKYGQQGLNSNWFKTLYVSIFECQIIEDPTNNKYPSQTLNKYTPYRKNSISQNTKFTPIFNYQISHLFGRTKNPLLFTSLWNLAYIPRHFDPFTGHESKGKISETIRNAFKKRTFEENVFFIEDYSRFYNEYIHPKLAQAIENVRVEYSLNENQLKQFIEDATEQLSPITLESLFKEQTDR